MITAPPSISAFSWQQSRTGRLLDAHTVAHQQKIKTKKNQNDLKRLDFALWLQCNSPHHPIFREMLEILLFMNMQHREQRDVINLMNAQSTPKMLNIEQKNLRHKNINKLFGLCATVMQQSYFDLSPPHHLIFVKVNRII